VTEGLNPAFLLEPQADPPHTRFGPMRILVAHNVPGGRNVARWKRQTLMSVI
jgi:hypothetical protein